ncbi:glucosylceramidase-like [Pogonomyrmex barbatus]|uniref:Glucosylceramidase n=1 Tax=Pogonomyrmex barbatus TaxID=144034 RepID=A0A6I9W732_9HYME|nr:glucosylceramidase-like [Pogonomyrmex barbatus]XP_011634446.1 glucosylceramidase-like [Pogonomyrmex barbatus]
MWRMIIFIAVTITIAPTTGCIRRRSQLNGDDDGHYCVCNAVYCDRAPNAVKSNNPAKYVLITSSKSGLRFRKLSGEYSNTKETVNDPLSRKIIINQTDVYQEIYGFGGSVTDAAAINIQNLTHETSEYLLRSYFGPESIDYSFIRTPMGGSDFSIRPYTYADAVANDTSLHYFNLQTEDYLHKIPTIKRAMELRKEKIKLLTAPWSAPLWMKTNPSWTHNSKLRPEYRQLWANYFVKFFEAYRQNGLEFWGTTLQNEPESYKYIPLSINLNAMAWTAEEERDWVIKYLAPTLEKNGFEHIKIFSLDDNRLSLPHWPKTVFQDERARDIISGVAIHYYYDDTINANVLNEVKQLFPEKSLIYTEACTGVQVDADKRVILGSWKRGEVYASNIIENLSHWVSTWIDWNIALNITGGPAWIDNRVDSPIIINHTANEFYKQPMFYALGHFSKYVPPKSVRIGTISENTEGIQNIAFSTPDGATVLVILNLNEDEKEILIDDPKKGTTTINVLGKSINTMKYW